MSFGREVARSSRFAWTSRHPADSCWNARIQQLSAGTIDHEEICRETGGKRPVGRCSFVPSPSLEGNVLIPS